MITCKMCEKEIRGNAAREDWNEQKGVLVYTCKACHRLEYQVGMGATVCLYTDAYACTIIKRTDKTLTLQRDTATLLNKVNSGEADALKFSPGGFVGHTSGKQRYSYETNPKGETYVAHWSEKKGRFVTNIGRVSPGRNEHYDFNF